MSRPWLVTFTTGDGCRLEEVTAFPDDRPPRKTERIMCVSERYRRPEGEIPEGIPFRVRVYEMYDCDPWTHRVQYRELVV